MATLAGNSIASTYTMLLKMDATGVTSSLQKIEDGDATDSALSVSTIAAALDATDKFYFDGGSDTYIFESGADVLDIFVGGANMIKLTESTTDTVLVTGDLTVGVDGTGHDVTFFSDTASAQMKWNDAQNTGLVIGADGTGSDVKFFGDTSGAYMLWDQSADDLILAGAAGLDIAGDIDVDGTANLDNTDIDGTLTQDAGAVVFNEAGADYDFRVEGSGEANALFVQGSDGFVGIGTAAPSKQLHMYRDDSAVTPQLLIEQDGTGDPNLTFLTTGASNVSIGLDNSDSDKFKISTATDLGSQPRLTIDASGLVGIGIATPLALLSVYADSSTTASPTVDIEQDGTGDASIVYTLTGEMNWATGIDNSDSDKFKISNSDDLANVCALALDSNSRTSLSNNDSGADNTVFGFLAGAALASGGDDNTVIGDYAGNALTTADGCVAIGSGAMLVHTTGGQNIAIGAGAMDDTNVHANTLSSTYNVFIGSDSGGGTWTGSTASQYNVAVGHLTMDAAMNGAVKNTAVGHSSLSGITTAYNNIGIGFEAGKGLTQGSNAIYIGYQAGLLNETGSTSIMIGNFAGDAGTDMDGCVLIGHNAGTAINANGGDNTVAIGNSALAALTSGAKNTAIGYQALTAVTTGQWNTAVGYQAADALPAGADSNTAIGHDALGAGNNASCDKNTCIGDGAGANITTGYKNTILGASSLPGGVDAINQTLVGYGVTTLDVDNSVVLGDGNVTAVYMAQDSGATVHCGYVNVKQTSTGGGSTRISKFWNDGNDADYGGINVQAGADDQSGTTIFFEADDGDGQGVGTLNAVSGTFALADVSDIRIKENVVDTSINGLDTVNDMKVRDFDWKKNGITCIAGFVANELAEAFAPAVTGDPDAMKTVDGVEVMDLMGVSRDRLVPVLVKAIQELSAKVTALENA